MVKQVSSNIPLPAAEHCQIASLQLLKPQTHPRVALTAFFAGSTSWKRLSSSLPKPPGSARLAQLFMGKGQVTKKNKSRNWFGIFLLLFGWVLLGLFGFLFSFAGLFLIHVNSLIQNSANGMEGVAWGQTPAAYGAAELPSRGGSRSGVKHYPTLDFKGSFVSFQLPTLNYLLRRVIFIYPTVGTHIQHHQKTPHQTKPNYH